MVRSEQLDPDLHHLAPLTPSSLEHLRIISEATACLRRDLESSGARRRRDESVRRAAGSHSVSEIAHAAQIAPPEVLKILGPADEDAGSEPRTRPALLARKLRTMR